MRVDAEPDGALRGTPRTITDKRDLSTDEFAWTDAELLVVLAEEKGSVSCFMISTQGEIAGIPRLNGSPAIEGSLASLSASPTGRAFAATQAKLNQPPEVMVFGGDAKNADVENFSLANAKLLAQLDMARPESVTVK